jgi:hypothetical protein
VRPVEAQVDDEAAREVDQGRELRVSRADAVEPGNVYEDGL